MGHYYQNFAKFCVMSDINFSLNSIGNAAKQVASVLEIGLPLLLYGEMGAGKTTLTKHIIGALGCKEEVTSPTFTIMQSYLTQRGTLWHIDLYRLDEHHIDELGLDELSRDNMLIIEWPQRLGSRLFPKYIKGNLSVHSDENRNLSFDIVK